MKLTFEVKPIIKKFDHRPTISEIVGSSSVAYIFSNTHNGWATHVPIHQSRREFFYGIRMEKHRRKCIARERVARVKVVGAHRTKDEDMTKTYTTNKYEYKPAYWIVHLYVIPIDVLKSLRLHACQDGMKTFRIRPAW
jgi:hypothetical protein